MVLLFFCCGKSFATLVFLVFVFFWPLCITLKDFALFEIPEDYSEWFAMPLAIVSTIASLLWNFQDQLIVLISMGLTSRYYRLNECLAKTCELDKTQMDSDKVRIFLFHYFLIHNYIITNSTKRYHLFSLVIPITACLSWINPDL